MSLELSVAITLCVISLGTVLYRLQNAAATSFKETRERLKRIEEGFADYKSSRGDRFHTPPDDEQARAWRQAMLQPEAPRDSALEEARHLQQQLAAATARRVQLATPSIHITTPSSHVSEGEAYDYLQRAAFAQQARRTLAERVADELDGIDAEVDEHVAATHAAFSTRLSTARAAAEEQEDEEVVVRAPAQRQPRHIRIH